RVRFRSACTWVTSAFSCPSSTGPEQYRSVHRAAVGHRAGAGGAARGPEADGQGTGESGRLRVRHRVPHRPVGAGADGPGGQPQPGVQPARGLSGWKDCHPEIGHHRHGSGFWEWMKMWGRPRLLSRRNRGRVNGEFGAINATPWPGRAPLRDRRSPPFAGARPPTDGVVPYTRVPKNVSMVAQLTPPESEFAALPDPSPGMLAAARAYDVAAVRAIADWFREQDGGEAAAASCALLAFDLEVELVRARQVREMLDQVRPLPPMS